MHPIYTVSLNLPWRSSVRRFLVVLTCRRISRAIQSYDFVFKLLILFFFCTSKKISNYRESWTFVFSSLISKELLNFQSERNAAFHLFLIFDQTIFIRSFRIWTVAMLATKLRLWVHNSIESIHSSLEYLFLWISFFLNIKKKFKTRDEKFSFNLILFVANASGWKIGQRQAMTDEEWAWVLNLKNRGPNCLKILIENRKKRRVQGEGVDCNTGKFFGPSAIIAVISSFFPHSLIFLNIAVRFRKWQYLQFWISAKK